MRDFTERFDGFRPEPIAVPAERLEQAWRELPLDLRDALELACRRIQEFHRRQRPADISMKGPMRAAGTALETSSTGWPLCLADGPPTQHRSDECRSREGGGR